MRIMLGPTALAVAVAPFSLYSQVAYDYPAAIPPAGAYATERYGTSGVVAEPAAGAPWDLTGYTFFGPSNFDYVWGPAGDSPYAPSFPTATYYLRTVVETTDEFYEVNSSGATLLGGSYAGEPAVVFEDPYIARVFPSMLGTTYTDDQTDVAPNTLTIEITPTEVGTLTTPYGVFTDVVRIIRTITPSPSPYTVFWFSTTNVMIPLAVYFDNYVAVFDPVGFDGVQEKEAASFRVFPVPASDHFTVNWADASIHVHSVELLDGTGHRVMDLAGAGVGQRINAEIPASLASGMYVLSVHSNTGDQRIRLPIVR